VAEAVKQQMKATLLLVKKDYGTDRILLVDVNDNIALVAKFLALQLES
jgi:hypothetical protein